MNQLFQATKDASRDVRRLTDGRRSELLMALADRIEKSERTIIEANRLDLSRMDPANPLYDRLLIDGHRLRGIASDMRAVASLPSSLGRVLKESELPNGLKIKKISVPFGVIGVIYEARPNVTFDVFSLCFKAGSACILKGGHDAADTNAAAVDIIKSALADAGIDPDAVNILPGSRESTAEMLNAVGYVDLVIPRGGRKLIDFVRDNARVPCIETGAGVVDTYFDAAGDLDIGKAIVLNAKTRRVSVCNALDCLVLHSSRLCELPALVAPLAAKSVIIYADSPAFDALAGSYPSELLEHSSDDTYGTEFMDFKLAVKTVDSIDGALAHIAAYGSGHSEAIVTEDSSAAQRFRDEVDAACVYVNAPTSFTDGAQFGLGAEIGISTQKLGARGPMGLEEITTCKWLIDGHGQTRP